MVRLLRLVLLVVIAILLVSVVVGIVTTATGVLEKAVLGAVGLLLVVAASRVRRLGAPPGAPAPGPGSTGSALKF